MNKVLCPNCGSDNNSENKECDLCKTTLKLNNKYYLKEVIGENNQITYLGVIGTEALEVRVETSDFVVLKELSITSLEDWKNKELFEREVAVLNSLNHSQIPNLIDYFELGEGKGEVYLVMEFIDGLNLKEEISTKRYTEEDALLLIEELLGILDYLHSFSPPIVHRDIKPSNIIQRKSDNKLVLIDFGAVTDVLKPEGGSTVVGTYGYMAPEQFMGKASVQSDYYSLGAIIIKLLTKTELHEIIDISDLGFIDKINVSDQMKVILMKLLTLDLSKRVKSVEEILDLIEGYRNNTLDLAFVGANLCIQPTDLPNKEKEIKEVKRKRKEGPKYIEETKSQEYLGKIKKDYQKLELIFNKIMSEKNSSLISEGIIMLPFLFAFGMMYIAYFIGNDDYSSEFISKLYFLSNIVILIVSYFFYEKFRTNTRKNKILNILKVDLKYLNIDDELVYLFIDEKFGKADLFFGDKKINKGNIIIYKNLLKKTEDK